METIKGIVTSINNEWGDNFISETEVIDFIHRNLPMNEMKVVFDKLNKYYQCRRATHNMVESWRKNLTQD
jgi:hypothetical protein